MSWPYPPRLPLPGRGDAALDSGPTVNTKILIVDDDPVYRKLLTMGLEFAGFDVSTAKNGADAKLVAGKSIFNSL